MYAANGFISTIFPNYAQKGVRKYVKTKSEPITVEMLREEAANWVVQDGENPGAWSMFVLETLQKMKWDYNITMQYLLQISKEQFDFVCEAIDEVVYSFQRSEMVDLIDATRSYEANATAFEASKNLASTGISLMQK